MLKNDMRYSLRKGLQKTLWLVFLFVIPQLVDFFILNYPEWAQFTLGGGLLFLSNLAKNWAKLRLP